MDNIRSALTVSQSRKDNEPVNLNKTIFTMKKIVL